MIFEYSIFLTPLPTLSHCSSLMLPESRRSSGTFECCATDLVTISIKDISIENTSTVWFSPTEFAMFIANAVLPIDGLPAITIKFCF